MSDLAAAVGDCKIIWCKGVLLIFSMEVHNGMSLGGLHFHNGVQSDYLSRYRKGYQEETRNFTPIVVSVLCILRQQGSKRFRVQTYECSTSILAPVMERSPTSYVKRLVQRTLRVTFSLMRLW